jgi:4-hydroxyphenylpyruvate dioxygenase (EC 1.13.11.27)
MTATINGFGFIEYAAADATPLHKLFRQMGFRAIKHHKSKPITLYRQRQSDFLSMNATAVLPQISMPSMVPARRFFDCFLMIRRLHLNTV